MCGGGIKMCIRFCINLLLKYGGKLCNGLVDEIIDCNMKICLSEYFCLILVLIKNRLCL